MKTISSPAQFSKEIQSLKRSGKRIGLVPTMGALHPGHLSLVEIAKKHADIVAMSIFVNPLQFNNKDDLQKYPRTLEQDSKMAKEAGVELVFAPSAHDIYPEIVAGENKAPTNCKLTAGACSLPLEGPFRPGHFDGVVTVVSILFHVVQPDVAVFGEKDFQQLKVIEEMVRDLHFPIEIITAPTIREKDGLAMSSRNTRLNSEQRTRALSISKALYSARDMSKKGVLDSASLETAAKETMERLGRLKVEYVGVVDRRSLAHLPKITQSCQMVIAAWCDEVRLIDNLDLSH